MSPTASPRDREPLRKQNNEEVTKRAVPARTPGERKARFGRQLRPELGPVLQQRHKMAPADRLPAAAPPAQPFLRSPVRGGGAPRHLQRLPLHTPCLTPPPQCSSARRRADSEQTIQPSQAPAAVSAPRQSRHMQEGSGVHPPASRRKVRACARAEHRSAREEREAALQVGGVRRTAATNGLWRGSAGGAEDQTLRGGFQPLGGQVHVRVKGAGVGLVAAKDW